MKTLFFTNAKRIITVMLLAAITSCHRPPIIPGVIEYDEPAPVQPPPVTVANSTGNNAQSIQLKYAAFLRIPPDSISNIRLYSFIDSWLNTPYLWGGTTRKGIDCSAFVQRLLADVYHIHIPRTSIDQFHNNNIDLFGSRHYLQEGDLIFFTTTSEKEVSHVGLYLGNRMFVNASTHFGVCVANLDTRYWKNIYVASGRVIVKK